jgi:hypothetical protein
LYNGITSHLVAFLVEMGKEVVYHTIGIRFADQLQPLVTIKSDKIKPARATVFVLPLAEKIVKGKNGGK